MLHANIKTLPFTEPKLLLLEIIHHANKEFLGLLQKSVKAKNVVCTVQQCRWPQNTSLEHFPLLSFLDTLRRIELLFYSLCRLRGHSHFTSLEKDGGHTVRSAIPENFMGHANITLQSQSYCQSKFFHIHTMQILLIFAIKEKIFNILFVHSKERCNLYR